MEHIIETLLENGYTRLTPEAGYALLNTLTNTTYSEAVVSKNSKKNYIAIVDGVSPEPHERTLDDAKAEKLAALSDFVRADKKFYIGSKPMWVGPEKRANLKNAVEALVAQGVESVEYEGLTIPAQSALQMITAVEAYAALHSMAEARHRAAIASKRAINTVDSYDFTTGFPIAPVFNP